jgi:hypothetical protein
MIMQTKQRLNYEEQTANMAHIIPSPVHGGNLQTQKEKWNLKNFLLFLL